MQKLCLVSRSVVFLLMMYLLHPVKTLDSVSSMANNISSLLIQSYNHNVNFSRGSGLLYIPWRDENGNFPPFKTSSVDPAFRLQWYKMAIGGIIVGVILVVLFLAGCLYNVYTKKNAEISTSVLKPNDAQVQLMNVQALDDSLITSITIDKSVEFSYEELSKATDDFKLDNKIGQGGFGSVYYAELRESCYQEDGNASITDSRQFLAELKVLTHTRHVNLVRLIGYCVQRSLFLVYEYIENGNLSQHLHGSERGPLPWSTRVQIALDSARGIEYIHEHAVPVGHVHCDIKSENILIDKNFHGKVADFGLTRLTTDGSSSGPVAGPAGTFGYMPLEYARYGDVSPKVDVFAFGVVLYELISAKPAIIRATDPNVDPKGLVALFDEVLSVANPKDDLVKIIDPRLGDNYPLASMYKMAQLAKECTREDPRQRPSMHTIMGALMTLSSSK